MKTRESRTNKTTVIGIRLRLQVAFLAFVLTELNKVVDREQDLHLS